jgi:hypothetical protein
MSSLRVRKSPTELYLIEELLKFGDLLLPFSSRLSKRRKLPVPLETLDQSPLVVDRDLKSQVYPI